MILLLTVYPCNNVFSEQNLLCHENKKHREITTIAPLAVKGENLLFMAFTK